jgi:ribokinase
MAGGRVVVVGSINTDMVVALERLPAPGETVSGGRFSTHGGGKGANQAVAAARLGAAVTFVGAVGDDPFGEEALALLAAEGIDVGAVARLASAPTGVALIAVDAAGENQIAVASGANAELDPDAVERAVRAALGDPVRRDAPGGDAANPAGRDATGGGNAVVLLGHEVPEAARLAGARAAGDVTIVLNPAPARALPDELVARGPILTPNAAEACELAGEDEAEAAARALAARTGAPVIVTLGARGVLLVRGGDAELLAAPRVDAVDTTGAGDAFNGALAAELAAGRDVRDATRFAVAAASLSTRAEGAREGMPRRADVEAAT